MISKAYRKLLPSPTKFIAVDIVPGPDKRGIPRGEIAISSYESTFSFLFELCVFAVFPCRRSYPMKKTIIPPAIWKAGRVNPNRRNIKCPNKLKMLIMKKATNTDLNATLFIVFSSASPTIDRNTGVLPMGLSMAKKPRKTVDKNKIRLGI